MKFSNSSIMTFARGTFLGHFISFNCRKNCVKEGEPSSHPLYPSEARKGICHIIANVESVVIKNFPIKALKVFLFPVSY